MYKLLTCIPLYEYGMQMGCTKERDWNLGAAETFHKNKALNSWF